MKNFYPSFWFNAATGAFFEFFADLGPLFFCLRVDTFIGILGEDDQLGARLGAGDYLIILHGAELVERWFSKVNVTAGRAARAGQVEWHPGGSRDHAGSKVSETFSMPSTITTRLDPN